MREREAVRAKVARKFPQLLEALAAGKFSLTVASLIAEQLTEENVERVLSDLEGMTKSQAELYRAALSPKEPVSPGIRKRPERRSVTAVAAEVPCVGSETPPCAFELGDTPPSTTTPPAKSPAAQSKNLPGKVEPATAAIYNFRFAAGSDFKEKFARMAEVLGISNPEREIVRIFDELLDLGLETKAPERKLERRRKRQARQKSRITSPEKCAAMLKEEKAVEPTEKKRSRYISPSVREAVFEKASYRCEYRSPAGVRCECRTGLEVDHVHVHAKGGTGAPENLRLLCPAHNLYVAECEFGREYVRAKIEGARRRQQATLCSVSGEDGT